MAKPYYKIDDDAVIRIYNACLEEARDARDDRMENNRHNREMFFGLQDFSNKAEGQSTEVLPKTAGAVERLAAFIKTGLTAFGDWFAVEMPAGSPVSPSVVSNLMQLLLRRLWGSDRQFHSFPVIVSDAVKQGMMESLIPFKIHSFPVVRVGVDPQTMESTEFESTALAVELLPTEDYYPDPTGRRLYEIHESLKDLYDVKQKAAQGIYDKKVVDGITDTWSDEENVSVDNEDHRRKPEERGQNETTTPSFRKKVLVGEYWGTLLDEEGNLISQNCLFTVANRRHLIRKPQLNPLWHGESPFVVGPLLRVPNSVWHRALLDDPVKLNEALNEVFNLVLDGGIASVWGVRQVHEEFVQDPQQLSGGVPQNATIVLKAGTPLNAKVVEQVATGEIPQDALALIEYLQNEFNDASITNDLKLGQMTDTGDKTATEVAEASQSYSTILDSLIADLEQEVMTRTLRKLWLTFLQRFDSYPAEDIISTIGEEDAMLLAQMPPAARYQMLGSAGFVVHGMSAVLQRSRTLQKILALLDVVGSQPWLTQAFLQSYSPQKIIEMFLKHANLDATELEADPMEAQQNMMQYMGAGAMGAGGAPPQQGGGPTPEAPQGPAGPTPPQVSEPVGPPQMQPGGM